MRNICICIVLWVPLISFNEVCAMGFFYPNEEFAFCSNEIETSLHSLFHSDSILRDTETQLLVSKGLFEAKPEDEPSLGILLEAPANWEIPNPTDLPSFKYTITVSNIGSAATSGTITVRDTLDPDLFYLDHSNKSTWSCDVFGAYLVCTTEAVINPNESLPTLEVEYIPFDDKKTYFNVAYVYGGGDLVHKDSNSRLASNQTKTSPPEGNNVSPCVNNYTTAEEYCTAIAAGNIRLSTADCDGDGVRNNHECVSNTSPIDPCDFNEDDRTLTPTTTVNCDNNRMLSIKVLLQGALRPLKYSTEFPSKIIMRDDLRVEGVIPMQEPYTGLGNRFTHVGGGNEKIGEGVLDTTGDNAIVDWLFIELRDPNDSTVVLATQSALVQSDGDVVSPVDGVAPLTFPNLLSDSVYVSVKHRNHLGVMTANPILLDSTVVDIDFTSLSAVDLWNKPDYDGFEQVAVEDKMALWAGNCNGMVDGKIKYSGLRSDQDPIFSDVMNDEHNQDSKQYNFDLANGMYSLSDVNLDGKCKYRGVGNDSSIIFFNLITNYEQGNTGKLYNYDLFVEQLP